MGALAQLVVNAEMVRPSFLQHEPAEVRVEVTNQSGRPIALGQHGNTSWLSIELRNIEGSTISHQSNILTEPFVLANGQQRTYTVAINKIADIVPVGSYRAKVHVYYPPLDRYFVTDALRFRVRRGVNLWSRRIGLPSDIAPQGGDRTYTVIRESIGRLQGLFVRIEDESRKQVYTVNVLGSYVLGTTPQIALSPEGVLHLVYQTTPSQFSYQQVDHMGNLIEDRTLSTKMGLPQLEVTEAGSVYVSNADEIITTDGSGDPLDPLAPVDPLDASHSLEPAQSGIQSLSERPSGLSFDTPAQAEAEAEAIEAEPAP